MSVEIAGRDPPLKVGELHGRVPGSIGDRTHDVRKVRGQTDVVQIRREGLYDRIADHVLDHLGRIRGVQTDDVAGRTNPCVDHRSHVDFPDGEGQIHDGHHDVRSADHGQSHDHGAMVVDDHLLEVDDCRSREAQTHLEVRNFLDLDADRNEFRVLRDVLGRLVDGLHVEHHCVCLGDEGREDRAAVRGLQDQVDGRRDHAVQVHPVGDRYFDPAGRDQRPRVLGEDHGSVRFWDVLEPLLSIRQVLWQMNRNPFDHLADCCRFWFQPMLRSLSSSLTNSQALQPQRTANWRRSLRSSKQSKIEPFASRALLHQAFHLGTDIPQNSRREQ